MSHAPHSAPDPSGPVTKAVVLARGLGTRLRRDAGDAAAGLSEQQQQMAALGLKAMMPVAPPEAGPGAAHPFVEHVISELADAGLVDVCLVIGPEHGLVREWFEGRGMARVRVSFAVQDEPLGTADAVRAAEHFAAGDRFVMVNSDNHYPADALRELVRRPGTATLGFDAAELVARSNIPAERVAAFALLQADERHHLVAIEEKPSPALLAAQGEHARVSMNCWLFGPSIFDACRAISPSARGEYEVVDAVRELVRRGETVDVVDVAQGVLDLSGRGDVAAVGRLLAGREVVL